MDAGEADGDGSAVNPESHRELRPFSLCTRVSIHSQTLYLCLGPALLLTVINDEHTVKDDVEGLLYCLLYY